MTDPMTELRQISAEIAGVQVWSPSAQAVLDAFRSSHTGQGCLAAALRAAADQLSYAHGSWAGPSAIINEDDLLALAAELDPTTTETTDD